MSAEHNQKSFLPMFAMLVLADYVVQLVTSAGIAEFQPLVSLWNGPLDDIFYGITGAQALYYLVDPIGATRESPVMGWVDTMKKIGGLLGQETYRRGALPGMFFTGSLRAVAMLGDGLILAVVANGLTTSVGLNALMVVLQRHLSYVLPLSLLSGFLLLWSIGSRPQRIWSLAMLAGFGALALSILFDGRWANHVHHLLAALSNPQAWGTAACWIAAGASLPMAALRSNPIGDDAFSDEVVAPA